MSSINAHFTFQYSQPEEYHFSHDSVFLARRAFEILQQEGFEGHRGLDLCAGCGIVGLDFLFHSHQAQSFSNLSFDFLEVQEVYKNHFEENRRRSGVSAAKADFILESYACLKNRESRYDLILSNPPYFRLGQGKMSPSEFKNRCRFFIDSDFQTLLQVMRDSLADYGQAFFLLRDLTDHGFHAIEETERIFGNAGQLSRLGDIRGTHFMRFKRNPR